MLWTGQIERNSGAVSGCEIDRGGVNEEIVSDERSWCKIIPVRVCVCACEFSHMVAFLVYYRGDGIHSTSVRKCTPVCEQ